MHLARPKTLITGASGFLGTRLTQRLLADGRGVVALTRGEPRADWPVEEGSGLHLWRGDLQDVNGLRRVLDQEEVEAVFHLAGDATIHSSRTDPTATFHTNIAGTWNILEACRRTPAVRSVVIASSDKAYGEGVRLPYVEDTPLLGRGPYEVSKACGDLIAQSYGHHFGVPVAVVRPGNFFGGGDANWSRLVPSVIRSALRDDVVRLRSDGTAVRDYLYIEDAVDAFVTIGAAAPSRSATAGEAFNVSSRNRFTVAAMVRQLLDEVGVAAEITLGPPASSEIAQQYLDPGKIERELGWFARTPHREAVRKTVAWYSDLLQGTPDTRYTRLGAIPSGSPSPIL